MASACFPVFKPVEIDNKKCIDGGFYDNVPISLMASKGVENIIVVDVSGFVPKSKCNGDLNIVKIKSTNDLGKTLDINPIQAKRNIKLGYLDTMKTFQIVNGKNYYLVPDMVDKREPDIGTVSRKEIRKNLGISRDTPKAVKRFITYKFFRTIESHMDIEMDINAAMAEITAEIFKVENTSVYTFKDLNDKILNRFYEIYNSVQYMKYVQKIEYIVEKKQMKGNKIKLRNEIKDNKKLLLANFCQETKNKSRWNKLKRTAIIIEPDLMIASLYLSMLLDLEKRNMPREKLFGKVEGFIQ